MSVEFPATRAEALRRLADFVPRAGRAYADHRNTDFGLAERDNVSVLSPYLRHRLITEREVVAAVVTRHGLRGCEKFVQEVLWRTYWKGWLELRPQVWTRFLAERDAARAGLSGGMAKAVTTAEAGASGIDGFDNWARELVETGYLHNHARMWFASIWIFTLGLPWTLGADFFLRHLLDADAASNTLSWRWVAGLQTAGKTYLATAENIARFTNGRFRPKGLATQARALDGAQPPPRPRDLPPVGRPPRGPVLALVTPDDLAPESLGFETVVAAAVVDRAPGWPWGEKAQAFVAAATTDVAARTATLWEGPMTRLQTLDAAAIIATARAANVTTIVTPYAPVGPVADALARIEPELAAARLTLIRHRRSWDDRAWPYATRGFFSFREAVPEILIAEGVEG